MCTDAAWAAFVSPPTPLRAGCTAAPSDLSSSFRLSPVSHGNTIALFFRSLLPNYTMEVCEHILPSLCHMGSGGMRGGACLEALLAPAASLFRRPGRACLRP